MIAEQRLWRTDDDRLVLDGHPDAAVLAYTPGDEISPADQDRVPGAQTPPEPKAAPKPADKSRRPAGNKGG